MAGLRSRPQSLGASSIDQFALTRLRVGACLFMSSEVVDSLYCLHEYLHKQMCLLSGHFLLTQGLEQ